MSFVHALQRVLVSVGLVLGLSFCMGGAGATQAAQLIKDPELTRYDRVATLAGGCFWCMEPPFEKLQGVRSAVSGYTGGPEKNPSYKQVAYGKTGHTEAVQVTYDPRVISYEQILHVFWRSMDPTDGGGQFADRGSQYRPGIFYHDSEQLTVATESRDALAQSGKFNKPLAVEITPFTNFYPAEDYHQDYYKKNYTHYSAYRKGSGREGYLKATWGIGDEPLVTPPYKKPSADQLQTLLTPLQFRVTQEDGTERPFNNKYWDSKKEGIYVDVVSGEPLFSSRDKFKSGTGWPSFVRPLVHDFVVRKEDRSHGMVRVEVRSRNGDSHLGHLFTDGPKPTGLRYCINSASLRFVPVDQMEKQGYGAFLAPFKGTAG